MFTRRKFLGISTVSLLGFAASKSFTYSIKFNVRDDMIKPAPLKENDVVGIVAPGTAVPSPDDLYRANEILTNLNLKPKFGKSISKGANYRTRTFQERLDDLMEMFLDNNVRAIFCIRGGYGSGQLLDKIDYDLIRKNPKVFVGYSDITALHIAFNKLAGLVTYHGPMLLSPFTKFTFQNFRSIIFGTEKQPKIQNPAEKDTIRTIHYIRTIKEGKTTGVVLGGNLSIICSLLGTPYQYNYENSILLLEDVQEEPYRIDRMLNQLRLAGIFHKVNGIAFGECNDCVASSQNVWDLTLGEVLDSYLMSLDKPSCYGLCFGHTPDQVTFAIGVKAEYDSKLGTIQYIENVTE